MIDTEKVFIIAEAGDNHNGSYEMALQLVDVAVAAGADCVKFQTFVTEEIICKNAEKAEYQKQNTGNTENQYQMVKKLELSFDEFEKIKMYCDKKNIMFLSTPFDSPSIEFLESLNIPFWKIPSGEITNYPYLVKIASTHKDIILSTGMSTIEEIRQCINVLIKNGSGEIVLLQCNTEYPTPMIDVNLRVIETLRKEFGLKVGYSDHSLGIEASIAAVALGASVIEKHFTLDTKMVGPDHKASLEADELKKMVDSIRNIEKAMGSGYKIPSESEKKNIMVARKSIVARKNIKKGEIFTEENLTTKRPGNGISPMRWNEIVGMVALYNFMEDELIRI